MRYIRLNVRPNRKTRRAVEAAARRAPTPETIAERDAMRKLGVSQPYENPARATRPRGKSARRRAKAAA